MRFTLSVFINILIIQQYLAIVCVSQGFDFFYFTQNWPGSFCSEANRTCCYPTTGKPASDFGIHGLWPNFKNGSYPSNCNSKNPFDESKISDLRKRMEKSWPSLACPSSNNSRFWSHEWVKHGTCSESVFDQHGYFEATLNLKDSIDILQILEYAGIRADGKVYSLESIKEAIKAGIGYTPAIECNVDVFGNYQLYEVYICVDICGTKLIECPIVDQGNCASNVLFPTF